jgi:Heterokaryon incompatibility protein (HET)
VRVSVDALCIDQQNRDERTQQVRLMTNIYSAAESVAVWLGPEDDDSELAMDVLRTVRTKPIIRRKFPS